MDETFLGEDALHRRGCFFFRLFKYNLCSRSLPQKKRRHQNRIRMVFFTCLLFSTFRAIGVPGFFQKGETKKVAFPAVPGDHPVPSSSSLAVG